VLHNYGEELQYSHIDDPLSINAFFNTKTLDYRVDNQAFVGFVPPQYFPLKQSYFRKNQCPITFCMLFFEPFFTSYKVAYFFQLVTTAWTSSIIRCAFLILK
jgi:hypothetical protein